MALDPSIPRSAFTGLPDLGQKFSNALLNVQRGSQIAQQREEAPLRSQLLETQNTAAQEQLAQQREQNRIRSIVTGAAELAPVLATGNVDAVKNELFNRKNRLIEQGLPTDDTDEAILMLDQPDGFRQLKDISDQSIVLGRELGFLKAPTGAGGLASAKTEILPDGSVVQALPNGEVQVRGPSGNIVTGQDRLDVLATSRQSALSKAQAISDIEVEAAGGKEAAKVEARVASEAKTAPTVAKTKAFINSQVKIAEAEAKERGEVLTDLSRAKAALPGLTDVVNKLRELAPIATSTFGGRVFDTAVKELGFGATKGATASAKFGAMVNNQVLPLLKPTFGAAFTVEEGKALRATMGDVNASVEEKMATLDAFMEQKQRDVDTKQLQLDQTPAQDFDLEFDPATGTFK